MRKRAWFFGDSFIYGWGCRPTTKKNRILSEIVSEYLDCDERNLARYGYSNGNILNSINLNLPLINDGDYVFIFDSHSVRSNFVNIKDSYYKDWISGSYFPINDTEIERIYGIRAKFEDELLQYYTKQFQSINSHLNKVGINSHYFSSNNQFWQDKKFTHQSEDVGGHWNYEGHSQAARWVLSEIDGKSLL